MLRTIEPFAPSGALAGVGVGAIGSLLTANVVTSVTRMFLWSPHTQLYNIFVPVFAIAAAASVFRSGLTRRHAIVFGLIIGIGITIYPVFPIVLALLVIVALWRRSQETVMNLAILVALSVAPYLIWYVFVRLATGGFYSHEIHGYNQVGWIIDFWREGTLLKRLFRHIWIMIYTGARQSLVVLGMLAIAGLLTYRTREKIEQNDRSALVSLSALSAIGFWQEHRSS